MTQICLFLFERQGAPWSIEKDSKPQSEVLLDAKQCQMFDDHLGMFEVD